MRICLWSGPRNVSTALMYSFAQRGDTAVVDEPLYAHYLRVSGAAHPGREEALQALESDGEKVVEGLILGKAARPVLFFKQMAHHLVELDLGFLRRTVNVILTRDPEQMLPSLINQVPRPSLADTGLARQCELVDLLNEWGREPAVLDSRDLLLNPETVLTKLCGRLGLDFDPAMLHWPPGEKPYDGVWAPYWYDNVRRSTGFQTYQAKQEPFPERLKPLLAQCRPYYERLLAAAIRG